MSYNAIENFTGNVRYVKDTGENLIQTMDYTPNSNLAVGTVVVLGNCPCIANENGPTGGGMPANIIGSLRIRGGIYSGPCDGAIPIRTKVYWNPNTNKFSLVETGNVHFGISITAAAGASTALNAIQVEHNPDGSPDPRKPTQTVAAAGANQGAATLLGYGFNLVTGATGAGGTGVVLPTGIDGESVTVKNRDSENAILLIYPDGAHSINALGASAAMQIAAKASATYTFLASTGIWYSTPLLPS